MLTLSTPNGNDVTMEQIEAGLTPIERDSFHRGRRAERFASAFGGSLWKSDAGQISLSTWFTAADALGTLMPSAETRAAAIAILDVAQGRNDRRPEGAVARTYFTFRKAAKLAEQFTTAGVLDLGEVTPMMWREARINAGLTSNEAPSEIARAAVAGIVYQRMTWR